MRYDEDGLSGVVPTQVVEGLSGTAIELFACLHIVGKVSHIHLGDVHARHAAPVDFAESLKPFPWAGWGAVEQQPYGVGDTLQVAAYHGIEVGEWEFLCRNHSLLSSGCGEPPR